MNSIDFVAIDFETATNSRMPCQMGIVVVQNGIIVEKKEYLFRPPENVYDSNCIKVHKITPDKTENALEFKCLWDEIRKYLHHGVVVAHNVDFEKDVLKKVCDYYDLEPIRPMSYVCTMSIYNGRSLDDICAALGISMVQHHNALSDATASAELFIAYLNGAELDKIVYPFKKKKQFSRQALPTLEQVQIVLESRVQVLYTEDITDFFRDKSFVLSGRFEKYERQKLKEIIESLGGVSKSSISTKTDFFIAGSEFGTEKMNKVTELQDKGFDIKIINEKSLYKLLSKLI